MFKIDLNNIVILSVVSSCHLDVPLLPRPPSAATSGKDPEGHMQRTSTSILWPISMQVSIIQLFSSYSELSREQLYRHTLFVLSHAVPYFCLGLLRFGVFWFGVGFFAI